MPQNISIFQNRSVCYKYPVMLIVISKLLAHFPAQLDFQVTKVDVALWFQ